MKRRPLLVALLTGFCTLAAQADYRAEAIQTAPDGQVMSAQIAVASDAVRTEFQRDGESVVQIINLTNGQQTMLFPGRKTYMQSPTGKPIPHGKHRNPCEVISAAQCVEQGRETLAGRQAVKWQITATRQGRNVVGTQWMDVERGLPLRMMGPNGEQTDMRLLGAESMQGREVEKWEVTTRTPNGQTYTGRQWYDSGLDTVLREELPDGARRELRNIRVETLPADMFSVPPGFSRIEPAAAAR